MGQNYTDSAANWERRDDYFLISQSFLEKYDLLHVDDLKNSKYIVNPWMSLNYLSKKPFLYGEDFEYIEDDGDHLYWIYRETISVKSKSSGTSKIKDVFVQDVMILDQ